MPHKETESRDDKGRWDRNPTSVHRSSTISFPLCIELNYRHPWVQVSWVSFVPKASFSISVSQNEAELPSVRAPFRSLDPSICHRKSIGAEINERWFPSLTHTIFSQKKCTRAKCTRSRDSLDQFIHAHSLETSGKETDTMHTYRVHDASEME